MYGAKWYLPKDKWNKSSMFKKEREDLMKQGIKKNNNESVLSKMLEISEKIFQEKLASAENMKGV
jgi:hypothetical protein